MEYLQVWGGCVICVEYLCECVWGKIGSYFGVAQGATSSSSLLESLRVWEGGAKKIAGWPTPGRPRLIRLVAWCCAAGGGDVQGIGARIGMWAGWGWGVGTWVE